MSSEPDFLSLPEPPSLWRQLVNEIRDRYAPQPEAELHLESKSIPVKEIWSRDRRLGQRAGSVAIHVAVIGILMLPWWRPVRIALRPRPSVEVLTPALMAPGPSRPRIHRLAGGGAPIHHILQPKLQPVALRPQPIVPPLMLMPATAAANLPLPQFGSLGAVAGPPGASAGQSGAGPGGAGTGASGGGDCVNGPCGIGGDISEPVPIYEPDPEYSDAARKAKFQGTVVVGVIIGADGHIYDPKIVQPLGLGLDQKALEAVKLWRFEPARKDGHPIRVAADIEVNFHLY